MKLHRKQQHPKDIEPDPYRDAVLRGAVAGAVHAVIAWLLEH